MLMFSQVFLIVFTTIMMMSLGRVLFGIIFLKDAENHLMDPKMFHIDEQLRDFLDSMIGTELAAMLMPQLTDPRAIISWEHYRNMLEEVYPDWYTNKGPNRVFLEDFWADGLKWIVKTQDNNRIIYLLGCHHFWTCHCIQNHTDKKWFTSIDVYDIVQAVNSIIRLAKEREDFRKGIRSTRYDAKILRTFKNGQDIIDKINALHAKYRKYNQ